jgi:two-component system chemotaxis sensor kinase CheA
MNEFLEQFLIESRELVEQANNDLLTLEHDPGNRPVLDSAFRAFHTLKGAAGIMEFTAMARLTHAAEDLLAAVRAGDQVLTTAVVNHCLSCLDQIGGWLDRIEAEEALPEDAGSIAERLANEIASPNVRTADTEPADAAPTGGTALAEYAIALLREQLALISVPPDAGSSGRLGAAARVCRNVLRHFGYLEEAGDLESSLALFKTVLLTTPPHEPAPADSGAAPPAVQAETGPASNDPQSAPARTLRVDVGRIEEIVKITGELIVAKNALDHLVRSLDDHKNLAQQLQPLNARFNRLTAELLRAVLATRVLPLQRVFQRFPRLVREMALRLQKPVRLITEGETTEADKVIVEALFEPILHVLRNAIDHGIEPSAERHAAGKPEMAIITLRARRDGDQVVIEIADDGAGIDLAAIRETAIRRQLVTPEAAAQMPDAQILDLIFLPGFSTARALSDISGRGVGMDAVRAAVERLGGRVVLRSVKSAGTTVSFVLPFTVMMTRVLTLHAGGQVFGVPFEDVLETVQLPAERVIPIGGTQAIILHGKTIPLVKLTSALDLAGTDAAPSVISAAVVSAGNGEVSALQVDGFGGQLDVILKPMEGLLAGMSGIAGSTLTGDGRVLIVLEVGHLLR